MILAIILDHYRSDCGSNNESNANGSMDMYDDDTLTRRLRHTLLLKNKTSSACARAKAKEHDESQSGSCTKTEEAVKREVKRV